MRKKISTTVYITPEQNESLKLLSRKTRVPVAEYIREAIDLLLQKYSRHIPGYQPVLPLDQSGMMLEEEFGREGE